MKLHELINIKTQDLSRWGITPHYEGQKTNYVYPPIFCEWLLNEAPFPIKWKETENGGLKGRFTSPDYAYDVNFEPFTYQFNGKDYDCVNVSFEVIKDGQATTELTPTNYSNQVIGTIQNSMSEKLIQFDIDAVIMIASDNVISRMKLYERMADRFAKEFGKVYKRIRLPKGEALAILANRIPEQTQEEILKFIMTVSDRKPDPRL